MRTQKNVYINRKWRYPEPFILLDIVYNSSWVKTGVRTGQIYDEDVFLKADASNIKQRMYLFRSISEQRKLAN